MRRSTPTIEELIRDAVSGAIRKVAPAVQRHVARLAAEQLERNLAVKRAARTPPRSSRRARSQEITKWVADRSARRVPNFVIQLTGGLDTKKKIVAKFGENAVFEKGKPLPKMK